MADFCVTLLIKRTMYLYFVGKRKLSEAVDDDQNIKRHSSEINGVSENMEERSAEGQTVQSHSNAGNLESI